MKSPRLGTALALLALAACAPAREVPAPSTSAPAATMPASLPEVDTLAENLIVRRIAEGVWLHVSSQRGITSNGLLLERGDSSILLDSAWGDAETERLAAWAADVLRKPVRRVISTHWHADRLSISPLLARGVHAGALDLTRQAALANGLPAPEVILTAERAWMRDPDGFEVFHPGHGHTIDNIVVYLPRERILLGGCLVKSADAGDMGNVADADLGHWPRAIEAVQRRYPNAAVVIPGHGDVGGTSLLAHTIDMIHAAPKAGGGGAHRD